MEQVDSFDSREAIRQISANLEQPHKFAEIFCNAAQHQKSIDNILTNNLISALENNVKAKDQIKKLQKEVNKEDWVFMIKGASIAAWSISLLFIGAIIKKFV